MVVAPEHPLLSKLVVSENKDQVESYVQAAAKKATSTGLILRKINPAFSQEAIASIL